MASQKQPHFFSKPSDFRKWLAKNHQTETELLVGFYKVGSAKPSINWSESVDQALCFGWIDGIRRSIDKESYSIRFTPRKASSIWSLVNIEKMATLQKKGLLKPDGLAAFEKRKLEKSGIYSHEKENVQFSEDLDKKFRANAKAWSFFESTAPSYQKIATNWVMSAKQKITKQKRFENLVTDCECGLKIKSQRR